MKFQTRPGLERALIETDVGARIHWLEGECDPRLLIVGIRFFIDEREAEAARRVDGAEGSADVEDISIRRLHRDPVVRALDGIEDELRDGESSRPPPAPKLLSVDERLEDAFLRRDEALLRVQPQLGGFLRFGHVVDHPIPGRGSHSRTPWRPFPCPRWDEDALAR